MSDTAKAAEIMPPVLCLTCDTPALDVRTRPSELRPGHTLYEYWCPACRRHQWHTVGADGEE